MLSVQVGITPSEYSMLPRRASYSLSGTCDIHASMVKGTLYEPYADTPTGCVASCHLMTADCLRVHRRIKYTSLVFHVFAH